MLLRKHGSGRRGDLQSQSRFGRTLGERSDGQVTGQAAIVIEVPREGTVDKQGFLKADVRDDIGVQGNEVGDDTVLIGKSSGVGPSLDSDVQLSVFDSSVEFTKNVFSPSTEAEMVGYSLPSKVGSLRFASAQNASFFVEYANRLKHLLADDADQSQLWKELQRSMSECSKLLQLKWPYWGG
ncbi:hypothetical protein L1887_09844 [Cichorium endivia]|nr:hypothetical protein L1887_09844 [Cichorium endivia]